MPFIPTNPFQNPNDAFLPPVAGAFSNAWNAAPYVLGPLISQYGQPAVRFFGNMMREGGPVFKSGRVATTTPFPAGNYDPNRKDDLWSFDLAGVQKVLNQIMNPPTLTGYMPKSNNGTPYSY